MNTLYIQLWTANPNHNYIPGIGATGSLFMAYKGVIHAALIPSAE